MNIVGIGNLIVDYYFFDDKIFINGGGTVSNILCNLSSMGLNTKIFGYYGADKAGNISKKSLEKAGVDTSLLEVKNYKTKRFYIDAIKTSSHCPFCGGKTRNYSMRKGIENFIAEDDIVLIQDYTLVGDIKNKICLDFGYFGSMIYKEKEEIERFIYREYFLVSIKDEVLLSLLRKLNISLDQFIEKCRMYLLIVTRGSRGVTIVFDGKKHIFDAARFDELETNGCGDVFFATFISETIDRKTIHPKDLKKIFDHAQENVFNVINNIGARNHIVQNIQIRHKQKCICEEFTLAK